MSRLVIDSLGDTIDSCTFAVYPNDDSDDGKSPATYSGIFNNEDYIFVTPDGVLHYVPVAAMDAEFDRLWEEETNPDSPQLEDIPDGDDYIALDGIDSDTRGREEFSEGSTLTFSDDQRYEDSCVEDGFPANEGEGTIYRDIADDELAERVETDSDRGSRSPVPS